MVECLTWNWGALGLSLTGSTALCPWARHINPSLVLVQPRKTRPYITERLLMWRKEPNQTNKQISPISPKPFFRLWKYFTYMSTSLRQCAEQRFQTPCFKVIMTGQRSHVHSLWLLQISWTTSDFENILHICPLQWDNFQFLFCLGLWVRASPASLRCGPWARHIYPSLVLVQPRKTRPCLTERLLMGRKE